MRGEGGGGWHWVWNFKGAKPSVFPDNKIRKHTPNYIVFGEDTYGTNGMYVNIETNLAKGCFNYIVWETAPKKENSMML